MKVLVLVMVAGTIIFAAFSSSKTQDKEITKPDATGAPVLIELFTSEGCSSCPPADATVEEIQKAYRDKNILVLCYHVDYWDRLGWKDPFSSADYTARQNYYADVFHLNTIYTPQAVVNGSKEFVGSDKRKLVQTIEENLKTNRPGHIRLSATLTSGNKIEAKYSYEGNDSLQDQLLLILVQKSATNEIRRGENAGKTLHHVNIVRQISQSPISSGAQKITFDLPKGLGKSDVFVGAFVQNKKTGKINSIQSTEIE